MKNSNTNININAAKELQDAMMAFGGSITRTMLDAQARTWEEMVRFSETTNKIATDATKEIPFMRSFTGFLGK
jgi:hypothetical protein